MLPNAADRLDGDVPYGLIRQGFGGTDPAGRVRRRLFADLPFCNLDGGSLPEIDTGRGHF